MDTSTKKSKYHCADVSWSIKIKAKRENISTIYNITPCKLKAIHAEDDILNVSPSVQNRNDYHR